MAPVTVFQGKTNERPDLEDRLDLLLATASHDLRAPLAGVKVAASTLASDEIELRPDQTRALAADIVEEVDRLSELIDTALDVQRLHADSLDSNTGRVCARAVITAALGGPRLHASRVEISVPPGMPAVRVDPFLLGRLIANLVQNALAASPRGEIVHIHAHTEGSSVRIAVVDRGPGIAATDRHRVFRPFERAQLSGKGTGLGLALVARFIHAMNVEMTVADTAGGGTTVTVTVPVDESEQCSFAAS
jgi:two-component system, OmpR family, sensor histidine kinase KdpD